MCCQELTALGDQTQCSETEGAGEVKRGDFVPTETPRQQHGGPFSWKIWGHKEQVAVGGDQMDDQPPLSTAVSTWGEGATMSAISQCNLHTNKPHFCFPYMYRLGVNPKYCSTEGNWGNPYLILCSPVLHTKIMPLKNTCFFLTKTRFMTEVTQNWGGMELPRKTCWNALLPGLYCTASITLLLFQGS